MKPVNPIIHNQCEAYSANEGKRCDAWGEYGHEGHRCCWLHMNTAQHPERSGGVIWIQEVEQIQCEPIDFERLGF